MTPLHRGRAENDFYPTPFKATRALLSVESFHGPIWEPACGDGAIAKVLMAARHTVVSTDLIDRGWGTPGVDFLTETENRAVHIVTNPPYGRGMADRFVLHALDLARPLNGTVAMLLDLAGLAHPLRTPLWLSHPPASIYILDELVCFPNGQPRPYAANTRFCWLVWKPSHNGRPSLWWLHTRNFTAAGDPP